MNTVLHLEWWREGAWHRIGWDAYRWQEKEDLREHGRRLAATGGRYRLTRPSVWRDAPAEVVHLYPVAVPA